MQTNRQVTHKYEAHILMITSLIPWLLYFGTLALILSKIFSEHFLKQLLPQDMITIIKLWHLNP